MPKLGILIVNWNRRSDLMRLLQDLENQTERADEIVVVDSNSTDDSREFIASTYPHIRLIALPENRGLSYGRNVGIAATTAELVAILDNDLRIPDRNFLAKLRRSVDSHADCGVISFHCVNGLWTRPAPDSKDVLLTLAQLGAMAEENKSPSPRQAFYEWFFSGGACVIRRSVFERVGTFDPVFGYGGEEWDFAYRCHAAGIRLLRDDELWVIHVRSPVMRSREAPSLILKNMVLAQSRYMPLSDLCLFLSMQFPKSLSDAVREGTVGEFISVCRQIVREWRAQVMAKRKPVTATIMRRFYFLRLHRPIKFSQVESAKTNALEYYAHRAGWHAQGQDGPRQYVAMFESVPEKL